MVYHSTENAIFHSRKEHGDQAKELHRGQRALILSDYVNIPNVISSPDSITYEGKNNDGNDVIGFKKGKQTVGAAIKNGQLELSAETTWVRKSINKNSLATASDANSPLYTPEANNGTAISASTISDILDKVNSTDSPGQKLS